MNVKITAKFESLDIAELAIKSLREKPLQIKRAYIYSHRNNNERQAIPFMPPLTSGNTVYGSMPTYGGFMMSEINDTQPKGINEPKQRRDALLEIICAKGESEQVASAVRSLHGSEIKMAR